MSDSDKICTWAFRPPFAYTWLPRSITAQFLLRLVSWLCRSPLSISLSSIIAILHDQILGPVVMLPREVRLQDVLGTLGISLLGIKRGAGHVRHRCVTATLGIGGIAERVLFGCGLREPNITTVTAEVSRLEGFGNVFFDNNGAAGGVDEP